MIVFLDANVIIYRVEAVAAFGDRVHACLNDLLTKNPGSRFFVSRLSVLECLVKPVRERNTQVIGRYHAFFSAPDLSVVEISPQVIDKALILRADSGLRTPDAIQAASALTLAGPVTFVTGDKAFSAVPRLTCRILS